MKKIIILYCLFLLSIASKGQGLDWAMGVAGLPDGQNYMATPGGKISTLDNYGNLYYTAPGGILRKLSTAGTITWTVNIGKNGYSVAADDFGFIYITGDTNSNVFIEKRDSAGNYIWTKIFEGGSVDFGTDIKVDDQANIYAAGHFTDSVDFDPGIGTYFAETGGAYILKLDSAGNFLWVYTDTEPMTITTYYNAIAVDDSGNVYGAAVTGHANSWSGFADKIDSSGSLIWHYFYQSSQMNLGADILGIVVDGGYVYTTGLIDYDPGFTGTWFIQKMDAAGNEIWLKKFGGGFWSWEGGIDVDADGNVYATGSSMPGSGTDFDPGPASILFTSWGVPTIFIIKLTSDGIYEWAHVPNMPTQSLNITSHGYNIAVDDQCNVYVTGAVRNGASIDIDPGMGETLITGNNLFLARMTCTATDIDSIYNSTTPFEIYPNPSTGTINITSPAIIRSVQITDMLGRVVYASSSDSKTEKVEINSASGLYYITLTTDDGIVTQKVLISR